MLEYCCGSQVGLGSKTHHRLAGSSRAHAPGSAGVPTPSHVKPSFTAECQPTRDPIFRRLRITIPCGPPRCQAGNANSACPNRTSCASWSRRRAMWKAVANPHITTTMK